SVRRGPRRGSRKIAETDVADVTRQSVRKGDQSRCVHPCCVHLEDVKDARDGLECIHGEIAATSVVCRQSKEADIRAHINYRVPFFDVDAMTEVAGKISEDQPCLQLVQARDRRAVWKGYLRVTPGLDAGSTPGDEAAHLGISDAAGPTHLAAAV